MIRPCLSRRSAHPHGPAPALPVRSAFAFLFAFALAAGVAGDAGAHLSIIRQGVESAGASEDGDQFGFAVATGDFNGDGYDDLATGAPDENVGLTVDAGSVVINWGSEFGLTQAGAAYLTATSIGGTSSANAQFGFALTSADFDHDGYADLVIGAPGETVSGLTDAGRIYFLPGGAAGPSLFTTHTQSSVGETVETGDRWGESFAVGNFNGDGGPYMDLAVGSPGEDSQRGMVAQFLGSSLLLLSPNSTTFRLSSFGIVASPLDRFGHSLAAGNLFGDSKDDLAVSAPNRTLSSNNVAGAVHLLRGTSTGLALAGLSTLSAADYDNVSLGGLFGTGLAAGRFFGGSFDALAVGEPGKSFSTRVYTGRVLVFRGGSLGIGTAVEVTQSDCGGSNQSNEFFGWNLAAGMFEDDASSYEDLGIGWSQELGTPNATDAGAVAVLYGGLNGPGNHGWAAFDQGALNDYRTAGDRLGACVAFGRFDASNKGALAVGAPGEDNDTGQVHIIAPWRQRFGLTCRNAVVTDCDGSLVFTLRPFDTVYIASTTKAMTTLVAAERTALPNGHPKHMSLNAEYTTPPWVAFEIPGSQVPLFEGEVMSLHELMWTCLFKSGNDAAFAIADFCEGSGGFNTSVPAFIQAMNDKAAALGMTGTHFHNPAGLDEEPVGPDLGDHYSTPYDMMLLSRAAMNNPLVREIVGSTEFEMTRRSTGSYSEDVTFYNIFGGVLTNNIQPLNGIKGGETGLAKGTGLFSVTGPGLGDAIITTFLTPKAENGGDYIGDAAHLAEVGLAECNLTFTSTAPHFENAFLGEFNTCLDCVVGSGLELNWGPPGDRTFLMARTAGAGALHAGLELEHQAEMQLAGGDAVPLGLSPFKGHGPVILRNMSNTTQTLQVLPSAGGTATQHTIPPQGYVTLPAWTSPTQLGSFTLTVTNMSTNRVPAPFQVEIPFTVDVTLNPPTPFAGGEVPVTLLRNAALGADAVFLHVRGQDATGGGRLTVVVKEPGAVSGVSEAPTEGVAEAPLARLVAGPNPSSAAVRLSFDLKRTGRVGAQLFDAQGRRVRVIEPILLEAGAAAFDWDGRDDAGRPVAHGLYFARVTLDDRPVASIKLMRLE